MIAELGAFCLFLALALSLAQVGLSAFAAGRRSQALQGAGEGAAVGAFIAIAIAFFALMDAFVRSDFSVANVAANSHTDKPLLYKVAGVWGSHEGSMLLWNLALTGYGAIVAVSGRGLPARLKSLVLSIQGGLGALFIGYTALASSPFVRLLHPPVEGNSLNPVLQDPFLAIHPPFLYSGYVGFSVVFSFAMDPKRGVLLLAIMGLAAGSGFVLFAWRAPKLRPSGLFAPVSREGALVLNNLFLAAATATVLLGTLYPLIRQALTGQPISVGPPFFNLTFAPLMAACLLLLPAGPLLTWKRADAWAALQRLWIAALLALAAGAVVLAIKSPRAVPPALGVALGAWLVVGAMVEIAERIRLGKASAGEVGRRLKGLPRGAWGMTLAHAGLGLFVLGACFESAWKLDVAQSLGLGASERLGAYVLKLDRVGPLQGPNFDAERALIEVTRGGRQICLAAPERRIYQPGGQNTSDVAICQQGLDDIYVVLGDRQPGAGPQWVVRGFFNPWARLIFFGPIIMALGGLISLSDRRLRFAAGRRAAAVAAPALEPAE